MSFREENKVLIDDDTNKEGETQEETNPVEKAPEKEGEPSAPEETQESSQMKVEEFPTPPNSSTKEKQEKEDEDIHKEKEEKEENFGLEVKKPEEEEKKRGEEKKEAKSSRHETESKVPDEPLGESSNKREGRGRRETDTQEQEQEREPTTRPTTSTTQDWVNYQVPELMKGCVIHKYCEASEIEYREDLQVPSEISENEVLVHIVASSVNPIDWKVRKGYFSMINHIKFPHILGCDASGVVVKSKIEDYPVGTEVIILQKPIPPRTRGTYAEYCIADASNIAKKPSEITHEKAAALPLVGVTVLQALITTAHLSEGEKILILGGSGGIGHIAVQVAKALGAYVYATCSSTNVDFVRSLGADRVIDYTMEQVEDVIGVPSKKKKKSKRKQRGEAGPHIQHTTEAEGEEIGETEQRDQVQGESSEVRRETSDEPTISQEEEKEEETQHKRGVDVVLDTIGGKDALKTSMSVLKPKVGRLITLVGNQKGKMGLSSMISQGMSMATKKIYSTLTSAPSYHFVTVHPDSSDLSALCDMVKRGEIHPHISSTYAPWEIQSAHEKSESGHTVGKIIIRIADDPSARPQG